MRGRRDAGHAPLVREWDHAFHMLDQQVHLDGCVAHSALLWGAHAFAACTNGEVVPFVGHNACVVCCMSAALALTAARRFLRWEVLQDAAFVDAADGVKKIWSESNMSEDFDVALRLKGYSIRCACRVSSLVSTCADVCMHRWASYSNGGFKEGVSLTVDDELNRWEKYAYGCNECIAACPASRCAGLTGCRLIFNPLVAWWHKGPITAQLHRFLWTSARTASSCMASQSAYCSGALVRPMRSILLCIMFTLAQQHFNTTMAYL